MRSSTLRIPPCAIGRRAGPDGTPTAPSPPQGPPGFSLVELCVGILLLEVGVLVLAGTAGSIVRMTVVGGREGGSSLVAASRLEELRASACSAVTAAGGTVSGASTTGPYAERWTVTADGPMRAVEVAVSYEDGRGTHSTVYETAIGCAP